MTDEESTVVHYTLLTRHNPDDADELRRYKCDLCSDDVFNLNIHAQVAHGTLMFDQDFEEVARDSDAPFHACGIMGCTFNPHETGPHSWGTETTGVKVIATPTGSSDTGTDQG